MGTIHCFIIYYKTEPKGYEDDATGRGQPLRLDALWLILEAERIFRLAWKACITKRIVKFPSIFKQCDEWNKRNRTA
jgi:hypothetical protein